MIKTMTSKADARQHHTTEMTTSVVRVYTHTLAHTRPVASLGLVSPGAATQGVTPIFPEITDDLFSVINVFHLYSVTPIYFPPKNCRPFLLVTVIFTALYSGVTPLQGVTTHLFYLSHLVCPLFFVTKFSQIFFHSGVSRSGPPPLPPLVTPLHTTLTFDLLPRKLLSSVFSIST